MRVQGSSKMMTCERATFASLARYIFYIQGHNYYIAVYSHFIDTKCSEICRATGTCTYTLPAA